MCTKTVLLDSNLQEPKDHGHRLQEFIRSTLDEMVSRRVGELARVSADADRPEVRQFIQKSLQSKLNSLGKEAIESVEDKIACIKAQRK